MKPSMLVMLFVGTLVVAGGAYLGIRQFGLGLAAPRPDLRFIGNVNPEPFVPAPAQDARLNLMLENHGEGRLKGPVQVVAYATDPMRGDRSEPVATGELAGPMEPGDRKVVSLPYRAPDEPQQLVLYFVIDPDQKLREATRENNIVIGRVSIFPPAPPRPDLVVSELRVEPAAPVQGQDMTVVVTVENRGKLATPDVSIVDLYVNDPEAVINGLPGNRRSRIPPLEPGKSVETSFRMRFDWPMLIQLDAQVDTDRLIDESDEGNNHEGDLIVAIGSKNQEGRPDLVVDHFEVTPAEPALGRTSQLLVRVKNQGGADTAGGFSVNVDYKGPENSGLGRIEGEPYRSIDLRFLPAGQSYDLPPIPVPITHIGTWKFSADVDPYGEVEEGTNEGNNRQEFEVKVARAK